MKTLNTLRDISKFLKILLFATVLVILLAVVLIDTYVYLALFIAVILFLVLVLALHKLNKFLNKLKKMITIIEMTEKLKDGELDYELDYETNGMTEYDQVATNLILVKENNKRLLNDVENVLLLLKKNDFSVRLNENYYVGDYKKFVKFLNDFFDEREDYYKLISKK